MVIRFNPWSIVNLPTCCLDAQCALIRGGQGIGY